MAAGQQPEPQQQAAPAAPPQEPDLSEYAQALLGEVPDEHKPILQQYVSKWDAGIQRQVQTLDAQYGPVAQMLQNGWSPEELLAAAEFVDLAGQDRDKALQILSTTFGWEEQQPGQQPQQQQQPPQQPVIQLPPQLEKQLGDMSKFMEQTALQQQQAAAERQQVEADRQLDEFMTLLEREKGPFDEVFVLARMQQGMDAAQAVDEWNATLASYSQSNGGDQTPRLPAPPVLSGGAASTGPTPLHKLSDADRRAAVMQFVQAANQSQAS